MQLHEEPQPSLFIDRIAPLRASSFGLFLGTPAAHSCFSPSGPSSRAASSSGWAHRTLYSGPRPGVHHRCMCRQGAPRSPSQALVPETAGASSSYRVRLRPWGSPRNRPSSGVRCFCALAVPAVPGHSRPRLSRPPGPPASNARASVCLAHARAGPHSDGTVPGVLRRLASPNFPTNLRQAQAPAAWRRRASHTRPRACAGLDSPALAAPARVRRACLDIREGPRPPDVHQRGAMHYVTGVQKPRWQAAVAFPVRAALRVYPSLCRVWAPRTPRPGPCPPLSVRGEPLSRWVPSSVPSSAPRGRCA